MRGRAPLRRARCGPRSSRRPERRPRRTTCEPDPANRGRSPVASPRRSRHSASRGSATSAAGSRSLPWSPAGPPRSSQARYTAGVEHPKGGVSSVRVIGTKGLGSTTSPMPVTRARPPTRQKATSAPRRGGGHEVGVTRPSQHRCGVGRASAESRPGRDALGDHDPGSPSRQRQGPAHQVVVAAPDAVGLGAGGVDRPRARRRRGRSRRCRRGRG